MPTMVRMRVGETMPAKLRKSLSYRTRMMVADDGDEFLVPASDARILRKANYAEEVVDTPAPRRGRPPKAREPEPAQEQTVAAEPKPLEAHTVAELREMVEARGIELPSGYVAHPRLIEMLRGGTDAESADH